MKLASVRAHVFGMRSSVERRPSTAAFTAAVLDDLSSERYTPSAWWRFWARSWARSIETVAGRSRAARETHLLHALLYGVTRDPRVVISWVMTWTHVALLPNSGGLGAPNVLTLLRVNLPLLASDRPRAAAVTALTSDFADGLIARSSHRETAFGGYADPLADAVFWTWFAWRFEPNPWLRRLAIAFWLAPPLVVTTLTFRSGHMRLLPRPAVARLVSAALQAALTARAFRRASTSRAP